MTLTFIDILPTALAVYVVVGILFALPFALWGASELDPAARSGSWGFRLLILPGSVALWPVLLLRWARSRSLRA